MEVNRFSSGPVCCVFKRFSRATFWSWLGRWAVNNLFWHHDRWALIDLDSMCQHPSASSFAPAYARDRARFMRNWPESSALYQVIDQRLPKTIDSAP
jgi:hypothetical protein